VKNHHAIAFTSSTEPTPEERERDGNQMLPGIRIVPRTRQIKLDKMSRIDFSRMYTVEHNVKVFDAGMVHRSHRGRLKEQWVSVIAEDSLETRLQLLGITEQRKDEITERKKMGTGKEATNTERAEGEKDNDAEDLDEPRGVNDAGGGPPSRQAQLISVA